MSVEAELIAAITAAPDDDAPRMVYADHLMQRGDPRGEFIALQCRLARAEAADEPGDVAVIARERQLHDEHADVWTGPLRNIFDAGYVFRRGFVEHVTVWLEGDVTYPNATREDVAIDRTDRLGELFVHAPLLRSITVRSDAILRPLPPSWARLRTVHLHGPGYSTPDSITFALAQMTALRRLQLTSMSLVDEQVAAVIELSQPLEHLGLHLGWHISARPGADIITTCLAEHSRLRDLRSLHLAGMELAALDRLTCLTKLERLSIDRCRVDPGNLIALVSKLPALTMLEYQFHDSETTIDLDLAGLLAAAPNLRRLALSGVTLGGDAAVLAQAPKLRRLVLERCGIGDLGARHLLEAPSLADAIELQITDDQLTLQTRERVEARALRYREHAASYPRQVLEMLPTNKIGAIKEYRALTGAGLADAKMAVEQIDEERTGRPAYGHVRAMSRWCRP